LSLSCLQQYRLSIIDFQLEKRKAQIQKAMVQELASWQASGSIDSLEVMLIHEVLERTCTAICNPQRPIPSVMYSVMRPLLGLPRISPCHISMVLPHIVSAGAMVREGSECSERHLMNAGRRHGQWGSGSASGNQQGQLEPPQAGCSPRARL
jgi:hypothetical protein